MLSALFNSTFGFLLLMGVLVTIHEFGHFYMARRLGFKVLTFSIGFGKSLWRRVGKDGVEYRIGLIPLGGYVAMLDDRVHKVKPEERALAFNSKPIWKRAAVIAAGPLINLIFAVIVLTGLYLYGLPAFKAKLDTPPANSAMAVAGFERGDLILSVDGKKTATYEEAIYRLIEYLDDGVADVVVERNGEEITRRIDLGAPLKLNAEQYFDESMGLRLYMPALPAEIGLIVEDGAGAKAGLQRGDKILELAGLKIAAWNDLLATLQRLNDEDADALDLDIVVLREGERVTLPLHLVRDGTGAFKLGVGVSELPESVLEELASLQTLQKFGPLKALKMATIETYQNSLMIFKFIGRMIKGQIHLNTMAGPVSIADIAGKTLDAGWVYFIKLLALFSVNLGVLNLLPIPVLDGGRLVGLLIEKVVGKGRIPEKVSLMTLQIGALLLFAFMAVVIFYDLSKWF